MNGLPLCSLTPSADAPLTMPMSASYCALGSSVCVVYTGLLISTLAPCTAAKLGVLSLPAWQASLEPGIYTAGVHVVKLQGVLRHCKG